jgi:hypothetical protein
MPSMRVKNDRLTNKLKSYIVDNAKINKILKTPEDFLNWKINEINKIMKDLKKIKK